MKLKPIDNLPSRTRKNVYNNIYASLDEFLNMKENIVEIDPIEEGYKTEASLYGTIRKSIYQKGYANLIGVKVSTIRHKVYLFKKGEIKND